MGGKENSTNSAGYVHDTGPIVIAKEQTKRYEQTITPLVMLS